MGTCGQRLARQAPNSLIIHAHRVTARTEGTKVWGAPLFPSVDSSGSGPSVASSPCHLLERLPSLTLSPRPAHVSLVVPPP